MMSRREKGGSADDVLSREDDHLAQRLTDPIATFLLDKEPPQAFRREILCDALRVETVSGFVQQRVVEVRGEHLECARPRRPVRSLDERHRKGVRLLAGGTTEGPDTKRLVTALREQRGPDLAPKHVERVRVAKEARHADQHIGVERAEFPAVPPEELSVTFQRVMLREHHTPDDASLNGAGLVQREVDRRIVA
jgi:hypothetical protein